MIFSFIIMLFQLYFYASYNVIHTALYILTKQKVILKALLQ